MDNSLSWIQVESLRRQDTSAQLRESQEQLAALREEHGRLGAEVGVGRGREKQLQQQLREVEGERRREQEQVEQVREGEEGS